MKLGIPIIFKLWIEDSSSEIDFGEGMKKMYASADAKIIVQKDKEVQLVVNDYGKGHGVYISSLPYSFENSRLLYRAVLWSSNFAD